MSLCKVQFTHTLYSGVCKQEILTWDDICDMVKRPITLKPGQESPLWSFYNMKGQYGEYGRLKGVADNVLSVICMEIDFDDGTVTIDQFKDIYKDYKYILYTSKSHTDTLHRFRVVMPLKQAIDNRLYISKSNRNYLQRAFAGCDSTTFDAWRKQRIPHKVKNGGNYIYHINEGELYEIDQVLFTEQYHQDMSQLSTRLKACSFNVTSLEIDPFSTPLEEYETINTLNNLIAKYTDELESINWTNRSAGEDVHYRSRKCIYSLRMNGMDDDTVFNFIMGFAPHKYQQEMYSMCYGDI